MLILYGLGSFQKRGAEGLWEPEKEEFCWEINLLQTEEKMPPRVSPILYPKYDLNRVTTITMPNGQKSWWGFSASQRTTSHQGMLKMEETVFSREEHINRYPVINGQLWKHIHTSTILRSKQVIFMNMYAYMCTRKICVKEMHSCILKKAMI